MGIGPAGYSESSDAAADARARLDSALAAADAAAEGQRALVAELIELWPTSAWIAAGATSPKAWLLAYTSLSEFEAHRLVGVAGLCAQHHELAEAVVSGALPWRRAVVIDRFATGARAPYLSQVLPALLDLNRDGTTDQGFADAVRFWADRVDEHVSPRTPGRHTVSLSPSLFGGGEIHGQLAPAAFANVATAIAAFTQDPDPVDAPYRRSLCERQADALDDLASAVLAGGADPDDLGDVNGDERAEWHELEELRSEDTYDGSCDTDLLDYELDGDDEGASEPDTAEPRSSWRLPPEPDPLRRQIQARVTQRRRRARRRTRRRSGVTINAHVDVLTLLGLRDGDDLDGLVMRGDGFALTRSVLEQLCCDSGLLATIFAGPHRVLDANTRAEQFSAAQRRAIAARDRHCVFPGCRRPPRFCDTHHLRHREHGGPTAVDNGALLCRFHHRLVHEHRWRIRVEAGHWIAVDPHGQTWTGRPAPPGEATAA